MATLTETFTNIADAIRSKTETTDKITPENMPAMIEGISVGSAAVVQELSITSNGTYRAPEGIDGYTPVIVNVPQDGSPPPEALVITGNCARLFYDGKWDWFLKQYGNQITTEKLTDVDRMFYNSTVDKIPFDLNFYKQHSSATHTLTGLFQFCKKITEVPKLKGEIWPQDYGSIFYGCYMLREIPEDFTANWNWSQVESSTSGYSHSANEMFKTCYSLRSYPNELLKHANPNIVYSYSIYSNLFADCYVLDEVVDLPIPYKSTWTSNAFGNGLYSGTFMGCNRLKRITFETNEDGTPKVVNWKNQKIELGNASNGYRIGFCYDGTIVIKGYNSGITDATRIYNDETYQALKDNPDSWTDYPQYSRYNKTSAIETINSLPDASAYLATQSGATNTINFYGEAGSKTDGGAINTMTEEEIAVAVAKGWTVSFA